MRRRIVITLLLITGISLGGCSRSLFADNRTDKTQFDTFDRMQGDYRPQTVPDVFGTPQPALRARLGGRD
ncbi:MAG: hypothetical protein O7G85_16980 [Planctomycetota bacterium]|nr:hypothetical protein [Planctomycetota bacterium]